jgi:hypothetical protein
MNPLAPSFSVSSATALHDAAVEESSYWAEGSTLVVKRGARLPDRCLLCNEPATSRIQKRLIWQAPWMLALVVLLALPVKFGVVLLLIASIAFTKRMKLGLPLCANHARRYRKGVLLRYAGLAGLIVFPVLLIARLAPQRTGSSDGIDAFLVLAVAAMFVTLMIGSRLSKLMTVKRIDSVEGRFTAGAAFLASCPDHWGSAEDDGNDSDE